MTQMTCITFISDHPSSVWFISIQSSEWAILCLSEQTLLNRSFEESSRVSGMNRIFFSNNFCQGKKNFVEPSFLPLCLFLLRSRNFYVSTHVNFTRVNKVETMYGRSRVNVRVEPRSTFTLTRGLSYLLPLFHLRT